MTLQMTLQEAYEALGLDPLEKFLNASPAHRITGATTWMLVEASLVLLEGQDVVLVGRNIRHAEDLAKRCLDIVFELGRNQITGHRKSGRTYCLVPDKFGRLFYESDQTIRNFRMGRYECREFSDRQYHRKALLWKDNPFLEIRRLKKKDDGSYAAFTGDGEYLLDLTPEGVRQLEEGNPYRLEIEE